MDQEGNVVIDSLPYVDEYSEQDALIAEKLIQHEMAQSKEPRPALEEIDLFANHPLLKSALEAAAKGQKTKAFDVVRLRLEDPKEDTLEAWQEAVNNAKAQIAHQDHRILNLELLSKYGANAWKLHNYLMESITPPLEQEAERLQEETIQINKRRKLDQDMHKSTLESLELRRQELLHRILSVRDAVDKMQS